MDKAEAREDGFFFVLQRIADLIFRSPSRILPQFSFLAAEFDDNFSGVPFSIFSRAAHFIVWREEKVEGKSIK